MVSPCVCLSSENVCCRSLDDNGSLVVLTTDKRSLYFFHRASPTEAWRQVYTCTSPSPDIYYTAMEILPILSSTPLTLVFLAGTDNQVYVCSFDIDDHSLTPLCELSVGVLVLLHSRVPRTGLPLFAFIAVLMKEMKRSRGIFSRQVRMAAAESGSYFVERLMFLELRSAFHVITSRFHWS